MAYYGKEKENHCGSHVRYFSCGRWYEGTLLEPVKFQLVFTKEHGLIMIGALPPKKLDTEVVKKAALSVADGSYSDSDLKVLKEFIRQEGDDGCKVSGTESVTITEANDISEKEAQKLKDMYIDLIIAQNE